MSSDKMAAASQRVHASLVLLLVLVSRPIVVSSLDNGFDTPPMGWSALYGCPFGRISEECILGAAQGLVGSGLAKYGYEYVNLDDWYAQRNPTTGEIEGIPRVFPRGIPAVSKAIHGLGLKFGVYSAASQRTCGNYSASEFREVQDANTFANVWEIDYLKYDSCLFNDGIASRARYTVMSRALNATGRKIRYSVEGWNPTQGDWGPEVANMWRTGNDIWPRWDECILHNLYSNNLAAPYQRVGSAFNDPDMVQPPATIPGSTATPGLTLAEAQSQFVLWAIMKSPLVLGVHWSQLTNLSTTSPQYYELLTNTEIINVNQDKSKQATLICQMPSLEQQQQPMLNVTLQQCDITRCDQKWVKYGKNGIKNADGNICLTERSDGSIVGSPCETTMSKGQSWDHLDNDSNLHLALSEQTDNCLTTTSEYLVTRPCATSKLPPQLEFQHPEQIFLWDALQQQIISGLTGGCVTLGNPNLPADGGKWVTNNGTLHHEVWSGLLANGQQVVVLFNKGSNAEPVTAKRSVLGVSETQSLSVRDVLAKKDLPPLTPGQPLTATVESHGVRMFIIHD